MKRLSGRLLAGGFGLAMLVLAGPALAQDSLDAGKTPAQLYASDCAACHKTPQGLAAKGGGILGLESFLREHYTASRESAAAIANYLRSVGGPPPSGRTTTKRSPKGDGAKGDGKNKSDAKTDAKSDDKPKSGEGSKSSEKAGDKPADKPAEAKSGESSGGKPAGGKGGKGGKGGTLGAKPPEGGKPD